MLSISTAWKSKEETLKRWFIKVKELGFDAVELGYNITRAQLMEAIEDLKELNLKVSSIHNFCPIPDDGPSSRHISNYYRLSSSDENERHQAVKWTCSSIDTAILVDSTAVVIHAGTLDFEDERSPRLFELYTNGERKTDAFRRERARILQLREEKRRPFIAAFEQSLKEVLVYAREKNVRIGLETRFYPIEIPNFDEIGYFLTHFGDQGLGYWHDIGHAEINDRLGITSHHDFLKTYKDYLIGVHLHGIEGRGDHLAPFVGDLDLNEFMPYFGSNVLRVLECKSSVSVEDMKAALKRLR